MYTPNQFLSLVSRCLFFSSRVTVTNGMVKISYKISRLPSPCLPWSCSSQNHATFFLFTSTATEKDSLVAVDFVQLHIVLVVVICIKVSRKSISLTKTASTAVQLFYIKFIVSSVSHLINIFPFKYHWTISYFTRFGRCYCQLPILFASFCCHLLALSDCDLTR